MRLFRKYFLNHNKALMILNCAIIDEDPSALELLKKYVDETPTLNLIGAYPSAIDAVDGIRHSHLDILFLAIHMQQISGLEFAKVVPKNVKIIFTTAFKEYAIEAYKVHAFDYLLKQSATRISWIPARRFSIPTCRTTNTTLSNATSS